jgi:hypothetical protein
MDMAVPSFFSFFFFFFFFGHAEWNRTIRFVCLPGNAAIEANPFRVESIPFAVYCYFGLCFHRSFWSSS